jgi:beta-N-acetylhexosaminidase
MDETRRLAGDVIATGIPGTQLDAATRHSLEELAPSGIILFRRNFADVEQLRALVRDLHALPSSPLVCIDHEGGPVVRLAEPFTHFPAAADVAQTADPEIAYAVGLAMGRELAAVGIDVDFAPVLDVNSNPANPVIGRRAFGSDAAHATAFGVATMRGLLAAGVLPCGKHFPGHGDTDLDSHLALPRVERARAVLEATELVPFRAAIAAGIPLLMTAHVVYAALDAERPATLSPFILRDLLRNELGYAGVVVSDDLEMRAVAAHHDVADAALASLAAGVDWLLVGNDLALSLRVGERLRTALATAEIDRERVRDAARRVRSLRVPKPRERIDLPAEAHRRLRDRIARA